MNIPNQLKEVQERAPDGLCHIMLDGLKIAVKVLEYRTAFGRVDVKISPVAGSGEKWVAATSLQFTT